MSFRAEYFTTRISQNSERAHEVAMTHTDDDQDAGADRGEQRPTLPDEIIGACQRSGFPSSQPKVQV
jgi:hypothetical protein